MTQMSHALAVSFRREVSVVNASEDRLVLRSPWRELMLDALTPGLVAVVRSLTAGGSTEDRLSDLVTELDGAGSFPFLYYYLELFGRSGFLCYRLVAGKETLATVVPMTGGCGWSLKTLNPHSRFRLSRFAYCHRDGEWLIVESPLSVARIILSGPMGVALFAELAQPRTCCDLGGAIDKDAAEAFVSLLASAALIAEVNDEDRLPEDDDPPLAQWAFHDLLFHSRSRPGRHDYPLGGTFPFLGKIAPLPALKPQMTDDTTPLFRPDIARLEENDVPFARVLERRRSIREYGEQPITGKQLGEFLYRVARVRKVIDPDPARSRPYQITSRPYPSGGATYDLELYLAINRCVDIPVGIYHYEPWSHDLRKLAGLNMHVKALLQDARLAAGLLCEPQVLIILASRFQRLSWKYTGLAYATALKNVGVLYQTMYLVATAMGLAPCGLGAGNAALFATTVGTEYFVESSVGEFLLGSVANHPVWSNNWNGGGAS
jgi:SagB-type dehydrogenase family enzyme